jgi:2-desacetyl-2-hydroxyethyl bacteriochlorophyllide A dehydrogenase
VSEVEAHTALLEAPRRFQLVARPRPVAGPGEVVLRIAATAVCHTDLEIYTGRHPGVRYPVVMGHESTGIVDSIGEGVTNVEVGQHVIVNPIIFCGECDSCLRGKENMCLNAGLFGREVEGSMSEYVRLKSRYVHPLPDSMPLADATLIETLATVRHAQILLEVKPGESVVVLGQGTTGLLNTAFAALSGAAPVIAISRTRWKLDLAERMGAHHVIGAGIEDAVDEVRRLTGGKGADVVIDTAGGANTVKPGLDMLRPAGRFGPFAVSHEPLVGVSTFPLYYNEIRIIGSRALVPSDMAPSIDLVAAGKIDVSKFVTARYPLSQASDAFEEYERNPGRILRIVIDSAA